MTTPTLTITINIDVGEAADIDKLERALRAFNAAFRQPTGGKVTPLPGTDICTRICEAYDGHWDPLKDMLAREPGFEHYTRSALAWAVWATLHWHGVPLLHPRGFKDPAQGRREVARHGQHFHAEEATA